MRFMELRRLPGRAASGQRGKKKFFYGVIFLLSRAKKIEKASDLQRIPRDPDPITVSDTAQFFFSFAEVRRYSMAISRTPNRPIRMMAVQAGR